MSSTTVRSKTSRQDTHQLLWTLAALTWGVQKAGKKLISCSICGSYHTVNKKGREEANHLFCFWQLFLVHQV
jgi:hypothetical protein